MKLRVYDKEDNPQVHDLSEKTFDERQNLFKKWYYGNYKKGKIECLCIEKQRVLPTLHLRKRTNISLVNNQSNIDNAHDLSCELNTKYKERLKEHGISVDDGMLVVDQLTDKKKKRKKKEKDSDDSNQPQNTPSKRNKSSLSKSRLSTLFGVILEKAKMDKYEPNTNKSVSSSTLAALSNLVIEGKRLINGNDYKVFVAMQYEKSGDLKKLRLNNNPKRRGHYLVVGWGEIEEKPEIIQEGKKPPKVRIPLYSVDDSTVHIDNIDVLKNNVYDKEIAKNSRNGCKTGYWVIWRVQHKKFENIFEDKRIAFIPAEENTKIPVESLNEVEMIEYLMEHNREFKKPLISNLEEEMGIGYRSDFIFYDTDPSTIVEVAGIDSEEYKEHLKHKEKVYETSDYQYKRWEPSKETINNFFKR